MKFVRQFMIILTISFVGELLHALLPLPVPASIYGLVLMLIGLQTGILPLSAINEAGGFLIEIMPMLFIPAGVGLMVSWGALKPVIIPISIIYRRYNHPCYGRKRTYCTVYLKERGQKT